MKNLPGVVAAVAVMFAGFWLADQIGHAILASQGLTGSSPVSGVPVAIVLGLLLRNLLPLPDSLGPGLKFATTTVLRLGIVLVGIRLSVFDVLKLGLAGLPVVLAAIATGMVFVTWFNRKLGLPPRLGTLVAAGTSICGVTAIVSTAPAIDADEREVAYAIANVVAFGLFGMIVYPYLAHALLSRSETIGLFLGTAVHDTSQVVGAALTYKQLYGDDVVLRTATVTKLTRNIFLAVVIPILTWMHARESHSAGGVEEDHPLDAVRAGLRRGVPGDGGGAVGGRCDAGIDRRRLRRVGRRPVEATDRLDRGLLGVAHAAGHGDGGRRPQHQLQGVQGRGPQAVRGRAGRSGRGGHGRHADGHCLRPVCHALTR